MTKYCSWRRAFVLASLFHLGVLLGCGLFAAAARTNELPNDSVIDLEVLTDSSKETDQETANGGMKTSVLASEPLALSDIKESSYGLPTAASRSLRTVLTARSGEEMAGASGISTGATSIDGAGMGTETTNVETSGGAKGTTTSVGVGTETAVGADVNTERGGNPFDFDGFANAVEANKNYPYMAIKRNIQGAVTIAIEMDPMGNLLNIHAVASSDDLLEKAALQAVRAACPYPNASGKRLAFTTTIHFTLE